MSDEGGNSDPILVKLFFWISTVKIQIRGPRKVCGLYAKDGGGGFIRG